MAITLPSDIEPRLKTWIEELLPERHDHDGAEPLNLEELEHSLRERVSRDGMKQRGRRAA